MFEGVRAILFIVNILCFFLSTGVAWYQWNQGNIKLVVFNLIAVAINAVAVFLYSIQHF